MRPLILKYCKQCGEAFETLKPEQLFCSTKCANIFKCSIMKYEKVCPVCNKKFIGSVSSKFCSKECSEEATKKKKRCKNADKICPICGKTFKGNGRQKYCSKECADKVVYVQNSVDKICPVCGKKFKGNGKKKYCSQKCASKVLYYKKKKSGTNETLCWSCKNACGDCSWSKNFTPVEGWKAKKTKLRITRSPFEAKEDYSYIIKSCPEYVYG